MSLQSDELKRERSKNLIASNNLHYQHNFVVTKGEMQYLFDENNHRYLDMLGGFSVVAFGHNNQYINQHIIDQLKKVTHSSQIFINQPIIDLAKLLHSNLDSSLCKSFFLNSGSEANEMGIAIAKKYTGKNDILYMEKSLHGRTKLTLEVTNMTMWHPQSKMNNHQLLCTSYYPQDNQSFEKQMEVSLNDIEDKLKNNKNIGCMIIEPIQGNGGVRYPHRDYFKRLKTLLSKYNVLLILDEAQTGLGRLGFDYAHHYFDFVPDILMTCKSLGNGLPISSITTTEEIANAFTVPSASTTGGNMVSCASAIGVLKYYQEYRVLDHIKKLIPLLDNALQSLQKEFSVIKSVRGIGLIRGIEFDPEIVAAIIEQLKDLGVIVGRCGENREVILIEPPFVIGEDDIAFFAKALRKVLKNF